LQERSGDEADEYLHHEKLTATYKAEPRIRIVPKAEREFGTVPKKMRSRIDAKTI